MLDNAVPQDNLSQEESCGAKPFWCLQRKVGTVLLVVAIIILTTAFALGI